MKNKTRNKGIDNNNNKNIHWNICSEDDQFLVERSLFHSEGWHHIKVAKAISLVIFMI